MRYLSPEQSQEKRWGRIHSAQKQFPKAARIAAENGLWLIQCGMIHYQLGPKDRRWLLNIYPSNRRLYHDPNKRGPFISVKSDWGLTDVVMAAVRQMKRSQSNA